MATRVQPEISTDPPGKASFPPGMANAFVFATFNALSFQIVLGSPMVLYARSLEASATVLGMIAGMTPLLVIFQVPAATHIARVGYKKFVYAGWGTRSAPNFKKALPDVSATAVVFNNTSACVCLKYSVASISERCRCAGSTAQALATTTRTGR